MVTPVGTAKLLAAPEL
jgi:hypothetical protein